MDRTHRNPPACYFVILFSVLGIVYQSTFAQAPSAELPDNAHASRYRNGWECDKGYKESDGACAAVKVPANAYATDGNYGRGWECNWGYIASDDQKCLPTIVPTNAHLNSTGNGWKCHRLYRKVNDTCVAIELPANAYLNNTSYGSGWECERGYKQDKAACIRIEVPKNGYLADSAYGSGWKCDYGYRATAKECIKVQVPENGYFTDAQYGRGWECNYGYQASKDICAKINLPDNAHLDYSGNDWSCNPPYRKRNAGCIQL